MNKNDNHKYDDIINLPHHQSRTRVHMSLFDRAAQFSPFAALTGYEDAVNETARLTEKKKELSEEEKSELSMKILLLQQKIKELPEITITYFIPDAKKSGGAYTTITGTIKKIDEFERIITLENQTKIPFDDILEISGEIFRFFYL